MKQCCVVSLSASFVERIGGALHTQVEPWQLIECVSYHSAFEALQSKPQIMLIDGQTMWEGAERFLWSYVSSSLDTWFIVVNGQKACGDDVMQLKTPLHADSLDFFFQNQRSESNDLDELTWYRRRFKYIKPILLNHFWNGILNGWILPDRTMITMAARGISLPKLENMHVCPILVKTVHRDKLSTSKLCASDDHIFFEEIFIRDILNGQENGSTIDCYSQKWAIIIYNEIQELSLEELKRRCFHAAAEAKDRNWQLSFYLGKMVLPEQLWDEWQELEHLAEDDVGYSLRIVRHGEKTDRSMVAVPDMAGWQQMIDEGKYTMAKKEIRTFLEDLAQKDMLDEAWLKHFQNDFQQLLFRLTQKHGIPSYRIFCSNQENAQHPNSSLNQLLGWEEELIDNYARFLVTELPDTIVKRAQRYILQNLDQDLSRERIASNVFISGGYLGRLFKKELHMSISEYVFSERMRLAAQLLEMTDQYVTTIAVSVGYSNFPYFSTQFKKYSGETPVEYRKRFRK